MVSLLDFSHLLFRYTLPYLMYLRTYVPNWEIINEELAPGGILFPTGFGLVFDRLRLHSTSPSVLALILYVNSWII
jgi:hypothetical protein